MPPQRCLYRYSLPLAVQTTLACLLIFKLLFQFQMSHSRKVYMKSRANWAGVIADCSNIVWREVFQADSPVDALNSVLVEISERRFPLKLFVVVVRTEPGLMMTADEPSVKSKLLTVNGLNCAHTRLGRIMLVSVLQPSVYILMLRMSTMNTLKMF